MLRTVLQWTVCGFLLLGVIRAHAQPVSPLLQLYRSPGGTDVVFQISSEPNVFYTQQISSNLTRWTSLGTFLAASSTLAWTGAVRPDLDSQFFRAKVNAPNIVSVTTYRGWTNALVLNNGLVEAVVVPDAGRVLQFRFAGASNGPFWENRNLFGATATPTNWNTEGSFGGDKPWPAPQADWGWPPPSGFDGSPYQASVSNGIVTLTSPVDSTYKIRTTRVIELAFDQPVMRIRTTFQRTAATSLSAKKVSVWVITQAQEPVKVYVPVPEPSVFTDGYWQLASGLPAQFRMVTNLISFSRDVAQAHKLGFDAGSIAWVGTDLSLRIDAPRVSGSPVGAYPDSGCSTEVYTNPGTNAPYVELECLGSLALLPVDSRMEFVTTYTLFRRTEADPDAEGARILNWRAE